MKNFLPVKPPNASHILETAMADHLIPFTEQDVEDLMIAVDYSIGEPIYEDEQRQRWRNLYERLKSYAD
jgi:hypothetical protein